jgi:predicted flap endonuclease-1-like 5' DNA nuclease
MILVAVGIVVGLAAAIAGMLLFGWLLWWLWSRRDEEKETGAIEIEVTPPQPAAVLLAAKPAAEEPTRAVEVPVEAPGPQGLAAPDDLKRIEGIGPRIAGVLQAAGIMTFAQLADADLSRLQQILQDADPRLLRLANPATWSEQAALAAAGQWEALGALQKELRAGRRA